MGTVIMTVLEIEARTLRDRIYRDPASANPLFREPISDQSWEQIKSNWMKPEQIEWLREAAKKSLDGF
jgi:hypothetical protein